MTKEEIIRGFKAFSKKRRAQLSKKSRGSIAESRGAHSRK